MLEFEDDGFGAAFGGAVVHGFDIVSVRVEDERGVIAGVIGPLAGRSIVSGADFECSSVEAVDGFAVLGLKGDVRRAGEPAG